MSQFSNIKEYTVKTEKNQQGDSVISWNIPALEFTNIWHPNCRYERVFGADWQKPVSTMLSSGAPVYCLYNNSGINCYTVALSETVREVKWETGIHEEDGSFLFKITLKDYDKESVKIYVNREEIPYYRVLEKVEKWWSDDCEIKQAPVPAIAKKPFYSTWYSFHQDVSSEKIEEQCKIASKLGFKVIITDDGWQTDDNNRGYDYCGDWKVAQGKMGDFRGHVAKVHSMGMKYMLWISLPFMGRKSENYERFKDKLLCFQEDMGAGVLDIRYSEVRAFLVDALCNTVIDNDLDGLKIDFIDEFYLREESPEFNSEMDVENLQTALDLVLSQVYNRLVDFKKDILIEFRQKYIGPGIRKYANILRVDDCPLSNDANRVGIADLKLISGEAAVHSDMLMWHKDERAENISIQLLNSFFGTAQLSVRLDKCRDDEIRVIKNYIYLCDRYFHLRYNEGIAFKSPNKFYPLILSQKGDEALIGIYDENYIVEIKEKWNEITLLNATEAEAVNIKMENENSGYFYYSFTATGETYGKGEVNNEEFSLVKIPAGGHANLVKK